MICFVTQQSQSSGQILLADVTLEPTLLQAVQVKLISVIEVLYFAVKVGRAKVALNSFVFEKRFFSFA
jgi:hypothetical protein